MSSKKEDLIQTACKLFCDHGFTATGIDKILKEAKVNKMTMYKYFKTKDDLVLATLERTHNVFIENVIKKIDKLKISPQEKIVKLFEVYTKLVQQNDVVRCLFINASAEFPDLKHPIHKAALKHKLATEKYIKSLLDEMKIKNSKYYSRLINAMSQGALVMAQVVGDKDYYRDIRKALKTILEGKF